MTERRTWSGLPPPTESLESVSPVKTASSLTTKVIRKNGDVLPTVLVDGFVAETWGIDNKGVLEIQALRRLTRLERTEINEEGERLRDFVTTG